MPRTRPGAPRCSSGPIRLRGTRGTSGGAGRHGGGGGSPLWSRDGRELFFVSGSKMMSVPIQTRPALKVGAPILLFDGGFNTARPHDFDVAPDGRFVAIRRAPGVAGQREVRIVMN